MRSNVAVIPALIPHGLLGLGCYISRCNNPSQSHRRRPQHGHPLMRLSLHSATYTDESSSQSKIEDENLIEFSPAATCSSSDRNIDFDFRPGQYRDEPVIDIHGRQWRSSSDLDNDDNYRLGLRDYEHRHEVTLPGMNDTKIVIPWDADIGKHSIMLRAVGSNQFVRDDERWLHRYDMLCRFHAKYGHTHVPVARPVGLKAWGAEETSTLDHNHDLSSLAVADDDEYDYFMTDVIKDSQRDEQRKLGQWAMQQRQQYWNMKRQTVGTIWLTQQRVEYLNELGFEFDPLRAAWETQYNKLKEFQKIHGHTSVRQNTTLGFWVSKQRYYKMEIDRGSKYLDTSVHPRVESEQRTTKHRGKLLSPLTIERILKLEAIGFVWNHDNAVWEKNFHDLKDYQNRFNTTRVPSSYPTLGRWVRKHRAEYRRLINNNRKPGEYTFLTPDRQERLDSIGFEWRLNERLDWSGHYANLIAYSEEFGSLNVPQRFHSEAFPGLGSWVHTQREHGKRYRQGRVSKIMTEDRYALLSKLGFPWNARMAAFQDKVNLLRDFAKENGHIRIPTNEKDMQSLYSFTRSMKAEFRKILDGKPTSLDEEKMDYLRMHDVDSLLLHAAKQKRKP